MNKLNPVFEAMNEIDDNIISETVKAKNHPIRIKAMLIAAAVTAAALFAGFTYAASLNIYLGVSSVQEGMLLPAVEEMTEWGAVELGDASEGVSGVPKVGYHYHFKKSTLPSDLFEKFNIHPLINDNFAEEITDVYANAWLNDTGNNIKAQEIKFVYKLIDRETDIPVEFDTDCRYMEYEDMGISISYHFGEAPHRYNIITLNDNSNAVVTDYEWGDGIQSTANFCYNGIYYHLTADIDMEGMKGILDRLGVL